MLIIQIALGIVLGSLILKYLGEIIAFCLASAFIVVPIIILISLIWYAYSTNSQLLGMFAGLCGICTLSATFVWYFSDDRKKPTAKNSRT